MKKTITISIMIILAFSAFNFGNFAVKADEFAPTLSIIANYNDAVNLDCNLADWNHSNDAYLDIYSMESSTAETDDFVTITMNYAYNDSHLFYYIYIPASRGHVKALDLHFFGKPEQNDGIHMYAYNGIFMDLVYPDMGVEEPPLPDEDKGGFNDADVCMLYDGDNGTLVEGSKPLNSGDIAGKDINLAFGDAIAVEIYAWIDIFPEGEGPNYGTSTYDSFRYVRLDIGQNTGDYLDIYPPSSSSFNWIEGEEYEAPYLETSAIIDGDLSDAAWEDAMEYEQTLSFFNFSDGYWDATMTLLVTIKIFHDGTSYYFGLSFYDEIETEGDFVGIVIGKGIDTLNDSSDTDFVMISSFMYMDSYLPWDNSEPKADILASGTNDGQGNVTYVGNQRYVEFKKSLQPNDLEGGDIDLSPGDYLYITLVIAQNSDDGPNYINLEDIDGKPYWVVHPVRLLKQGETPTGNNNDNTIMLAFELTDLAIIFGFLSPLFAIFYLRRKKK